VGEGDLSYLDGKTFTKQSDDDDDGTSGDLANTIWVAPPYTGSDGTVITATLSFSTGNTYNLSLNIEIGGPYPTINPTQSGTYTLIGETITLTKNQADNPIYSDPGTLQGNTISKNRHSSI
jgi:hypothetical protein